MRTISDNIKAVLESNYMETKDVVIITLPEQFNPPSPEVTLYLANGANVVIEGQAYSNKLRGIGTLRFALGSAPDNADVKIENVSRDLGFILTDQSKIFDGARIVIKRAFKIEEGVGQDLWETVTLFIGEIRDIKIDQEIINLTAVSDMSKRGTNMAQRTLTQRCIWIFNAFGSGIGPNCDWRTTQPGDPSFCDHTIDGESGCKSHGNLHMFGGVSSFTSLNSPTNTGLPGGYDPNDGGGWGDGSGGGWCVHPDTWIMCENENGLRYWVKAYAVKAGETVVTVDKFGRYLRTKVVKPSKGTTSQLFNVVTENGCAISCSPSHPFITSLEDVDGTPCHKLQVGQETLTSQLESKEVIKDKITSIEIIDTNCHVIILQLEEPHHVFLGGSTKDGAFLFHNLKPIDTLDRYYMI